MDTLTLCKNILDILENHHRLGYRKPPNTIEYIAKGIRTSGICNIAYPLGYPIEEKSPLWNALTKERHKLRTFKLFIWPLNEEGRLARIKFIKQQIKLLS